MGIAGGLLFFADLRMDAAGVLTGTLVLVLHYWRVTQLKQAQRAEK